MSCFTQILSKLSEYRSVAQSVEENTLPLGVTGLSHVHKMHFIGALGDEMNRRALILTDDEAMANRLAEDLNTLYGGAYVYPAKDISLYSSEGQSREYEHIRLGILSRMLESEYNYILCPVDAAMQLTLPPEELYTRSIILKAGQSITPEQAVESLLRAGYVRAELVDGISQFSLRGGILDFFPPHCTEPIRIEFWGDEIDTISHFSLEDQRRTDTLKEVRITPCSETLFDSQEALAEKLEILLGALKGKNQKAREKITQDIEKLQSHIHASSTDRYLPLAYDRLASIFDYAEDALLFVCETARVKERARTFGVQMQEELKGYLEEGIICPGLDRYTLTWAELLGYYEDRGALYFDSLTRGSFDTGVKQLVSLSAHQLPLWSGSLSNLLDDVVPAIGRGETCAVMAGTEKNAKALHRDLTQNGVRSVYFETYPKAFPAGTVSILLGSLSAGFDYPGAKFTLFSQGRLNSGKKAKTFQRKRKAGEEIHSLEDLHPGDYIVHSIHGIGIFNGVFPVETHGVTKDYIKISYAKGDALYVPVTQLDLVSKYIGPGEDAAKVKIHRLGGKEWKKARSRVRSSVREMAKELVALYAKRMATKGFAFLPDTDLQHDFELRFPFEETDDQLRCVREIKGDMQSHAPMDRLLCGDVGFGKTEVALRAAFKCISEGKQCALLVPTTILALQHYQTILARMENFALNIEMISRFRTPAQQKKIMADLRAGSIDLLVGTHRIISKDIQFKDLGLLIIDEEQRFGVAQKEKLKEKFPAVDVLTLSATPIPRTLNMAMSGIRDMSILEEAPQDRHPIQTYVMEYDFGVLLDAIRKELRRGGQVYYLHNRVDNIERIAARIQTQLPDASIGVAHGQMTEKELSEIWRKLLEHEIDILVCTTIIETGVDVPNVNTLIIEDADRMGLAQLHQLRGRVGRSSRRATAYLTFTKGKALTEIATRRLDAIREYTEFGSGFKIAMRDLEIRGAGNILGAQQHGQMEAVGYDMYIKLLSRAVSEEKGEELEPMEKDCLIDLPITAHIPESYIPATQQRLSIYRRIADIRSEDDASDVYDELIDRFGEPPQNVQGLIDISLLRNTATQLGIYEISQKADSVVLYSDQIDMQVVARLDKMMRSRIKLNAGQKPHIAVRIAPKQTALDAIRQAFAVMLSGKKEQTKEE